MKEKATLDTECNIFLSYAGAFMFSMTKGESKLPPTPPSGDTSSMEGPEPELETHTKHVIKKHRALDFVPERDFEMWTPVSSPGPKG